MQRRMDSMSSKQCLTVGLLTLGVATGCVSGRTAVFQQGNQPPVVVDDTARQAAATLLEEAQVAWKARTDVARIHDALAAWEAAAAKAPDADTYVKLARGYYFLADTMALEPGQDAHVVENADLGTRAAERALQLGSPEFAAAVKAGAPWEDAVKDAPATAVPALYWYALNLGRWAGARGMPHVLTNRARIKATMAQCLKLDPDYFHAGPHRYFGAYYAAAPFLGGQDLGKSERHFRESLTRAPAFLATRVLMADGLAVQKKDRALFEKLLKDVLATEINPDSDLAPEQELEKKKAADLLSQVGQLF
jgi:hypothetical protein